MLTFLRPSDVGPKAVQSYNPQIIHLSVQYTYIQCIYTALNICQVLEKYHSDSITAGYVHRRNTATTGFWQDGLCRMYSSLSQLLSRAPDLTLCAPLCTCQSPALSFLFSTQRDDLWFPSFHEKNARNTFVNSDQYVCCHVHTYVIFKYILSLTSKVGREWSGLSVKPLDSGYDEDCDECAKSKSLLHPFHCEGKPLNHTMISLRAPNTFRKRGKADLNTWWRRAVCVYAI